jgi:hypothetical protein
MNRFQFLLSISAFNFNLRRCSTALASNVDSNALDDIATVREVLNVVGRCRLTLSNPR